MIKKLIMLVKFNTLRNQILIVFLLVMIIVLFFVGITTFNVVSTMLESNAEDQIKHTAVQASGRIETLYKQIDMISNQVGTNDYIQHLLINEVNGIPASFAQRQSLRGIINQYQAYSDGISSFEIYNKRDQRLFPLDQANLTSWLNEKWIEKANEEKGRLVWIGQDPRNSHFDLAIRQISLIDRWFSRGGYLLVRINTSYFQFNQYPKNEYMMLLDRHLNLISTNYQGDIKPIIHNQQQIVTVDHKDYIFVKQISGITGWTMVILTPIKNLMKGISTLKAAIILSGLFGLFIFFIFSVFLSTLITRPILKLANTMRQARQGVLKKNQVSSFTSEIRELNNSYNQLVENTNHLIQVVYEKELVRSRTELKALQAQINPHFLFNTLDALYWSLEVDNEDAAELVLAMADLFRYTISNEKDDGWVTIRDELDHVERYMQIMKMRFGERLKWEIVISKEYEDVKIPKLIIQPLVENAISHGVGNKKGTGFVSIIVERAPSIEHILVKVLDDGPGMAEQELIALLQSLQLGTISSKKGHGMALDNVNKRLELYYPNSIFNQLKIESELNKGTSFSFQVPRDGGRLDVLENDLNC